MFQSSNCSIEPDQCISEEEVASILDTISSFLEDQIRNQDGSRYGQANVADDITPDVNPSRPQGPEPSIDDYLDSLDMSVPVSAENQRPSLSNSSPTANKPRNTRQQARSVSNTDETLPSNPDELDPNEPHRSVDEQLTSKPDANNTNNAHTSLNDFLESCEEAAATFGFWMFGSLLRRDPPATKDYSSETSTHIAKRQSSASSTPAGGSLANDVVDKFSYSTNYRSESSNKIGRISTVGYLAQELGQTLGKRQSSSVSGLLCGSSETSLSAEREKK